MPASDAVPVQEGTRGVDGCARWAGDGGGARWAGRRYPLVDDVSPFVDVEPDDDSLDDDSLDSDDSLDDDSLDSDDSLDDVGSPSSVLDSEDEPASELVSEELIPSSLDDELIPSSLDEVPIPPLEPPPEPLLPPPLPLLSPPPPDFEQPASDASPAASPAPVSLSTVRLSGRFEESDMVFVGRSAHSSGDAWRKRVF
ncbi:MAG: hypothetical protein ABEJ80_01945 [Halarchaeum sp.]